ncbi:sensor histidine kinase [Micromonospora sp. CA-263727]|uniref:sensor histidine kinase n=1 Tax=Micromonospora sp. CA-263727 TaxID=3239967 RepID=UPI003D94E1CC
MDTGRPTWRSRAWLVAAGVLFVLALVLTMVGVDRPAVAWTVALTAAVLAVLVLAWALQRTRAQRRRYEEELAAWAGERAAQAERLRIAADLHDLVSHGLGLITVRAAVARTLTGPDGENERAAALTDIERVSRETTTELRRMLAVLHDPGAAPLRPANTLDDLAAIVQEASALGVTTTLGVDGPGEVSPGVQLTVCAVVREALHNTIRHAGPTHAHVGVHRDGETIVVDVQDAGPQRSWQPQPGAGHGLDGLRERVTALGGTLDAEPDEHGFHVTARIPDQERS